MEATCRLVCYRHNMGTLVGDVTRDVAIVHSRSSTRACRGILARARPQFVGVALAGDYLVQFDATSGHCTDIYAVVRTWHLVQSRLLDVTCVLHYLLQRLPWRARYQSSHSCKCAYDRRRPPPASSHGISAISVELGIYQPARCRRHGIR